MLFGVAGRGGGGGGGEGRGGGGGGGGGKYLVSLGVWAIFRECNNW